MQSVFLELVKLSLIGSLFAAAVILVRLIFRKAPKWLFCVLWGVVALRLICPVSIESSLSLVPDRLASGQIFTNVGNEYIGDVDIIYESNAGYSNAIEAGRQPIYSGDGYYVVTEKDSLEAPKTVGGTIYPILSWVWVAGMVLMFAYTAVSYLVLRKKMEEATHLRENIWQCEQVDSPFVLGIIKPRIYLPYAITESDMANVIAHEQAHIHRKDHWWKPIGFLLLSVHWFNPVLWLAYILLCRDIEAACDEKVIKHMEKDEMRAYSTALLNCSVHRRRIAACPLAFGETGVKERIKRVMNYKKPAFWIIIAAVVACSVAVICFVTNPKDGKLPNIHSHAYVVEEVTYESGTYSFSVVAGENSPIYAITEDMTLVSQKEVSEEGIWAQLGKLEEIKLTKDNFDELFFSKGLWAENANAKSIRKNTVNAWQLIYNQDVLYYALQQKNGDLYLAYGYYDYSEKNDPYSDDTNIRWLFKLAIDTSGMSGMVAKSGDGVVPMLSFPKGTMIKDYVDSIYWLTINPSDEELVPFSVWKDGEEQRGFYTAYDAITFEPLKHFMPSGLDPQTYLFQKADPTRGYIVLATFSTEPNAEIYAFGAKFNGYDADSSKLSSLVNEIANNPDCAASSNPFTFIEAKKPVYNEILTYGSTAVDFFVEQLRTGENGLQGYIMAVACADITGIGDKDLGADWGTAQEWLALYDKSDKSTIIPPVIATDYISGKQARLLSFGYTADKAGQSVIACGIAPYQGDYSDNNTLVLDGESGQNQILLTPKGASFSQYRIYLPDGTVYDDGTRTLYDSLSLRVMNSGEGICLTAPFQTGEYIYEVELSWPEQGLTVIYGLKIVMTGKESDYDRALDSVFDAYGEGNPLIAVSLVDKYAIGNAVSHSPRYLFKVENIPNAPIWVEVSQTTGEIIAEVDDPDKWLVDPPHVENQTNIPGGNIEGRQMTLADVVELSKLGMELTWENLKEFNGADIGSGLYVVRYDIDPEFYLLVGDGKTTGKPMYASLNAVSNGASCDIREGDVETFIEENQSDALDYAIHKAVIEHNADGTFPDFPNGFIPTQVHYIYGIETKSGTPVVGQLNHMEETTVYVHYVYSRYLYTNGELTKAAGNATPAKLTFSVDPEKGYTLKEFWEPNGGNVYAEEIRANFPKEIADIVLDPQSDLVDTEKMEHACLVKVQEYISSLTD